MATILSFSPQAADKRKRPAPSGVASIIIFPGIRYERQLAAATPAATGFKPTGGKPRRSSH